MGVGDFVCDILYSEYSDSFDIKFYVFGDISLVFKMKSNFKSCVGNEILKGKEVKLNHDKKPYVKKIYEVAGFDVWLVDGRYIRAKISEDFVNYDQHYHLPFIPKNEFWIDDENIHDEIKYYIDHLFIESKLMSVGKSYGDAYSCAAKFEMKERNQSAIVKYFKNKSKNKIIEKLKIKKIKEYSRGVNVWVVNGEMVRDFFFSDFAGGGHDKVYPFIPKNEIWLDDDLKKSERDFIFVHELHERNLMAKGLKYHESHKSATEIEDFCRKEKYRLKVYIEKNLEESKKIIIDFPYFIQEQSWTCGAACFRMILKYFGVKKSEEQLIKIIGTNKFCGTSHKNLVNSAKLYNFQTIERENGNLKEMKKLLKNGWKIIVEFHPFLERITTQSHYAIVYKIKRKYVWLVDPTPPNEKFSIEKFEKIWKDKKGKKWFLALKLNKK